MHETTYPSWAVWTELGLRALWVLSAVAVALVMGGRGHDRPMWGVIGLVLGPLAAPVAVVATRRASRRPARVLREGRPGPGTTDVVVVVDPDAPSAATAPETLSARRVVLVSVVGRDEMDRAARAAELRRAQEALAAAVPSWKAQGVVPDAVILEGRPARAVLEFARAQGFGRVLLPGTEQGERDANELRRSGLDVRWTGTAPALPRAS